MRFLTRIFSLLRHCVLAVEWNCVSFDIAVHVHALCTSHVQFMKLFYPVWKMLFIGKHDLKTCKHWWISHLMMVKWKQLLLRFSLCVSFNGYARKCFYLHQVMCWMHNHWSRRSVKLLWSPEMLLKVFVLYTCTIHVHVYIYTSIWIHRSYNIMKYQYCSMYLIYIPVYSFFY